MHGGGQGLSYGLSLAFQKPQRVDVKSGAPFWNRTRNLMIKSEAFPLYSHLLVLTIAHCTLVAISTFF